ncbi:MAG: T9SS type A sorting domain-containing protein [Bacteroidales bacterium]|nr:T9SS type A sorting domain-containing protein [Bacteroidales bacterium]
MNASFQLTRVNNTTALVSKKDQVVKTQWNGSDYINNEIIEAEGNYFYKGTSTGSKSFIVNSTRSGIECFNAASTPEATIHIGYPVNNIVANTTGNKLYMFHKQNSENTGLFVHNTETGETVNLNTDDNDFNNITGMIGDVVYNPYKKQFLVAQSNFASGTYNIKIINDDADNSSPGVIPLPTGVEYPKEMYIGPDKKLYIMANMQSGSQNPKVCVYTADDSETHDAYELIENYNGDISFSGTFADDFEYWSAQFCYNAANNKVYATIHPTEYTLDPYVSVPNSMFNYDEPMLTTGEGTGTGSIVRFDNTHVQSITSDFFFPGKIICPNESSGETNSQYADKIFVIGEDFYEYDFVNPTNTITHEGLSYNDIIYSPELDMLFAMRDKRNPDCSADRRIQIDKIYYDNDVLKFEQIDLDGDGADGWIAGQAAGFFYNPYDMNIYIHLKFDNKKLGGTNVSLLKFDPSVSPIDIVPIDLGMTGIYPELDHNGDYRYFLYNINQPYINPYTNKIYVPNGAHSKVSVVDFVAREPLFLNPVNSKNQSFTWLSFPRLDRNSGDPKVNDVLGGTHIDPNDYKDNSQLENLPPQANIDDKVYNVYDKPDWPDGQGITNIYSPRGYKLTLDYRTEQEGIEPHLYLDGTVIAPSTPVTLYAGEDKENWTGYWLYPTQDIFDALGDAVDDVYEVYHQDWFCKKGTAPFDPQGETQIEWYCDKQTHNIRYGEMVVLKSSDDIDDFQWNIGGFAAAYNDPSQNPSYFTYEEQATYTPLLVELDSADQPLEIGAMINDTCIGATVVYPGDSIVVIRAYMENSTSDSVSFEMYYGTKSTARNHISSYYVWDRLIESFTKRALRANEKEDYYFISLKNQKQKESESSLASTFVVWPNPSSGSLFYSMTLENEVPVSISIFDIAGKRLAEPVKEMVQSGMFTGQIPLTDSSGKKLKPGIYLVKLKAGRMLETKKVIVK